MKTTLEQWRMLQAVVEHGSFAKASAAIHKSQSSINTAVHKLQSSLGVELLRVNRRRTELTELGQVLLRRGNRVLNEVERIEMAARELAGGTEVTFKVAVDSIFPGHRLFPALDQLSRTFPHVRVELIETILSGSNELLLAGEVAVAISPDVPAGLLPEASFQIEFRAVAGAGHPLATAASVTREDLKAHRQIVVRDSAQGKRVDAGWLEAEQRWTVSSMATSLELIRLGYGYAWLPLNRIADDLESGSLRLIPLDRGQSRRAGLHLVTNDEAGLRPAARCFVNAICQQDSNKAPETP